MGYKLSRQTGDVTLIVKPIDADDDDEAVSTAPPRKRRKLSEGSNAEGLSDDATDTVKVSSLVLRSSSVVFDQMLTANMQEQKESKVIVHAKSVEDVEAMVFFMCTDQVPKDARTVNLARLAHCYQMDGLFWKCVERMVKNISLDTFVETVGVFEKYEIKEGYQSVIAFGKANITELKKRD